MPERNKTQRRTERETADYKENPTGPTTREERLRDDMVFDEDLGGGSRHSVGGGHEAQEIASRDQEQAALNREGGHARLHKKDEQPLWDRKPNKPASARS
jgi:hypothetical protein